MVTGAQERRLIAGFAVCPAALGCASTLSRVRGDADGPPGGSGGIWLFGHPHPPRTPPIVLQASKLVTALPALHRRV